MPLILLHSYYYICIGDCFANKCWNHKNAFLGWVTPSLFVKISNEDINIFFYMNIQIFMHHLRVYLIIQTFALSQYGPIKLYCFLLSFIFWAKYLAWASPAHNFDFLSINSKWLAFNICFNIYVHLVPSEDIWPESWPNI